MNQKNKTRYQNKICFIGGIHRSGTTPLTNLLGTDSNFSIFRDTGVIEDEGQFLQSVLPLEKKFGAVGEFALDPRAHLTEYSPLNTKENRELLFSQWAEHWDLSRSYLVEKTPSNLIRIGLLNSLFPNSLFIIMTRHPVATALAVTKWKNTSVEKMIKNWIKAHELMENDLKLLNKKNYLILKYEEFTTNPSKYKPDFEKFFNCKSDFKYETIRKGLNSQYFNRWKAGDYHLWDNDSKIKNTMKSKIFKVKFKILEKLYERKLNKFGYSFSDIYD